MHLGYKLQQLLTRRHKSIRMCLSKQKVVRRCPYLPSSKSQTRQTHYLLWSESESETSPSYNHNHNYNHKMEVSKIELVSKTTLRLIVTSWNLVQVKIQVQVQVQVPRMYLDPTNHTNERIRKPLRC